MFLIVWCVEVIYKSGFWWMIFVFLWFFFCMWVIIVMFSFFLVIMFVRFGVGVYIMLILVFGLDWENWVRILGRK